MARTGRAEFLETVRQAVAAGAPPETGEPDPVSVEPSPPPAGDLGELFAREAAAADAEVIRAGSLPEAREAIRSLLRGLGAKRVVRGDTGLLHELALPGGDFELRAQRLDPSIEPAELRAAAAAADVGLTEVDYGIAESGSLVLLHRPGQGRLVSLLPPVHVAILRVAQLLPDLGALFRRLASDERHTNALTFISGPSRTGDIEFVLTKGVHGPRELHVVLVDDG